VGDLTRAIGTMQQRLREQESARRTFVATASHELRTPLASMLLTLEEVEEDLAGDDPDLVDAREQVARAGAQTRRLTGLAADLLDLSRIDAGVRHSRGQARRPHRHRRGAGLLGNRRPRVGGQDRADPGRQRLEVHTARRRG